MEQDRTSEEWSLTELAFRVGDGADAVPASGNEIATIRAADQLERRAHDRLQELVDLARSRDVSWQSIGDALGISRQGAFKRFGGHFDTTREGTTMAKPSIDLIDRTESVFQSLSVGDYEAVRALMTYTCARALTKRKIMAVWNEVVGATGQLEACVSSTVRTPDGRTGLDKFANRHLMSGAVVQTTLRHEAGEWIGRVAYNGSGKITGLLIAPPGASDLPF